MAVPSAGCFHVHLLQHQVLFGVGSHLVRVRTVHGGTRSAFVKDGSGAGAREYFIRHSLVSNRVSDTTCLCASAPQTPFRQVLLKIQFASVCVPLLPGPWARAMRVQLACARHGMARRQAAAVAFPRNGLARMASWPAALTLPKS